MKSIFISGILILAALTANAQKDKPIEVYLIGGQSNATGQGYMANRTADMLINERVLLFHSGKPHLNSGLAPVYLAAITPGLRIAGQVWARVGFWQYHTGFAA